MSPISLTLRGLTPKPLRQRVYLDKPQKVGEMCGWLNRFIKLVYFLNLDPLLSRLRTVFFIFNY